MEQFESQCIQFLIPIETRAAVSVSLTAIINEFQNLNSVSVTVFVSHVSQILAFLQIFHSYTYPFHF